MRMKYFVLFLFFCLLLVGCERGVCNCEEEGVLRGWFSVSEGERVRFSRGNLQYRASTDTWRFGEEQWDVIGDGNGDVGEGYDGWIDLFGWGTSGHEGSMPWETSDSVGDYGAEEGVSIGGSGYDWGVRNRIVNGGNRVGEWRLLTRDEWGYILMGREGASDLWGVARVNGVNGLVLLPDGCVVPEGVVFRAAVASDSGEDLYRLVNDFDVEEWRLLEEVGAVFFPAAGARIGKRVMYVGVAGYYWSETVFEYDGLSVYCMGFDASRAVWEGLSGRCNGRSVRLVK